MAVRPTTQSRHVIERLRMELERLRADRDALSNQIIGIERAIALLEGSSSEEPRTIDVDQPVGPSTGRRPRVPIKDAVISLIIENQEGGLNAAGVIQVAEARGLHLDRASVSSLLSRLKKDGVLSYDGQVYRPAGGSRGTA